MRANVIAILFALPSHLRHLHSITIFVKIFLRWGPVEEELACIKKHLDQQSISLVPMPQVTSPVLCSQHPLKQTLGITVLCPLFHNSQYCNAGTIPAKTFADNI